MTSKAALPLIRQLHAEAMATKEKLGHWEEWLSTSLEDAQRVLERANIGRAAAVLDDLITGGQKNDNTTVQ